MGSEMLRLRRMSGEVLTIGWEQQLSDVEALKQRLASQRLATPFVSFSLFGPWFFRAVSRVAFKEFKLNYHHSETILFIDVMVT